MGTWAFVVVGRMQQIPVLPLVRFFLLYIFLFPRGRCLFVCLLGRRVLDAQIRHCAERTCSFVCSEGIALLNIIRMCFRDSTIFSVKRSYTICGVHVVVPSANYAPAHVQCVAHNCCLLRSAVVFVDGNPPTRHRFAPDGASSSSHGASSAQRGSRIELRQQFPNCKVSQGGEGDG